MRKSAWIMRLLMFISSYFPLYILLFIYQFCELRCLFGRIQSCESIRSLFIENIIIICVVLFLVLGVIISLLSIVLLKKSCSGNVCHVEGVKRTDDKVMDYVFTYILPILSFSPDNPPTVLVNVLLFSLLGYLYVKLNLIFINPLWTIFGYVSYEYKDGHIITDMSIEDLRTKTAVNGVFLANGIFLSHSCENQTIFR